MTAQDRSDSGTGWWQSGRWIPWTFVGGFGVVIGANVALILFSLGSWTGLETTDAYRKGLAYNDVLAAAEAQAARGWEHAIDYADERLEVRLRDADGRGLEGLVVTATFIRPTNEGDDVTVLMAAEGAGRYGAPVALPYAGNWDVRVRAEGIGEPWFASQRLWVR